VLVGVTVAFPTLGSDPSQEYFIYLPPQALLAGLIGCCTIAAATLVSLLGAAESLRSGRFVLSFTFLLLAAAGVIGPVLIGLELPRRHLPLGAPNMTDEGLAATPAPREERRDLIGLLAGLAGVSMAREELMAALRSNPMIDEHLRELSLAELFIEEGERRMAHIALQGRFGPLPQDILAALQTADEATLQEIVAHITTETLEQIKTRLGLQ
jgi:hypothetical protein